MSSRKTKVNVIGAGVVGLTTALVLQRNGFQVTVLAEHMPGDNDIKYTSPFAGAHWRGIFDGDPKLRRFETVSFKALYELARKAPDSSAMYMRQYDFYDYKPESEPWFKDLVPNFKVIKRDKLPKGAEYGIKYTTVTLNVPKYLRWLRSQFTSAGGKTYKAHLTHISEAFGPGVDVVVNCTGLGARTFGGVEDGNMYPTRGQTVVVWAPHVKASLTLILSDTITYIIPRDSGEVVLGGTLQDNNYDPKPDQKTAESILQRCSDLYPPLTYGKGIQDLHIISHKVGLRPSRVGGVRLETEMRKNIKDKDVLVCHNYGHAGCGYQASWGAALETLELIEKALESRNPKAAKL